MAQEAAVEEVVDGTVAEEAKLAAFQAELDARPDRDPEPDADDEPGDETEQQLDDEVPVEADPGEAEAVETPAPVLAEGPSFLMKRAAVDAGLDERLVDRAQSDAQLELMIEAAKPRTTVADELQSEFDLPLELPEDEFGPDDPIRKTLATWQTAIKVALKEVQHNQGMFARFANTELEQREKVLHDQLYSPFDEVLDSFTSDVLGNSKKLSSAQMAERTAIAQRYVGLGATVDMSAEDKQRYAQLALSAHRKDLVDNKQQTERAKLKQSKQVLGGGHKPPLEGPKSEDAIYQEWQDMLDKKAKLARK